MSSNDYIICLIIVVLCTKFQDSLNEASTRSEVEIKLNCTSDWQRLQLNWRTMMDDSAFTQNFSSFWIHNEEYFKNQTVNRLLQTVIYPHNFTKNFSCYGNVAKSVNLVVSWVNNVSFNVTLPKIGSELVGIRFLSLPGYHRRLEFYIRPRFNINEVNNSLSYCVENDDFATSICPAFTTIRFNCYKRDNNVYGIPSSAGFVCQAFAIEDVILYRTYSFHIQSMEQDGSSSISTYFQILLKQSVDDSVKPNGREFFTVVLMAQKSGYLLASTTDQKVVLKWENLNSYSYRIEYSCNNGLNANVTSKDTSETISNENFRPYSLCRFCVTSQASAGSLWSEPTCNKTRFPEILPSRPPTIICDHKTCPTTPTGQTQTVTVKCKLPRNSTWNGLLTHLVINYNGTSDRVYNTINLTSCEVKLTGLSVKRNYYAQMSVCNSEGCSSYSDTVLIAKAVGHPRQEYGSRNTSKLYWLFMLTAIIPIVIIFVVLFVRNSRRKRAKKEKGNNLPDLEDDKYENFESSMENKVSMYNELSNGNTGDNKI